MKSSSKQLKDKLDLAKLPKHVAIIMDGNGRWAKKKNRPRVFGHKNGVKAVREVSEAAAELGVPYLTLYAFSTENWNRPAMEVTALMGLLVDTIRKEVATLMDNNIRLEAIGDISKLPPHTYQALREGIEITKNNSRMTLILALNYSARWEITEACRSIVRQVTSNEITPDDIDVTLFARHLATKSVPDPELLIRTSGESRISNFLLWQIAYTELYFSPVYWPDFDRNHFYQAIYDFQNRERRFGMISEQLA